MPKANLWIINYCILEMKADNEPAISLPVYFESVKIENMFFDKKKKERKKERKKEKSSFRINQAAICHLRMIHLIKIPPFHT